MIKQFNSSWDFLFSMLYLIIGYSSAPGGRRASIQDPMHTEQQLLKNLFENTSLEAKRDIFLFTKPKLEKAIKQLLKQWPKAQLELGDVLQETFVRFFTNVDAGRLTAMEEAKLQPYLKAIALNIIRTDSRAMIKFHFDPPSEIKSSLSDRLENETLENCIRGKVRTMPYRCQTILTYFYSIPVCG